MGKVLCFGEILLRISLDREGVWLKEQKLPFFIGGAELNVARALALWNVPTAYFSAFPQNILGNSIESKLKSFDLDCTHVHRSGKRIGLYYLSEGSDLKSSEVVYDRANSSFSDLRTENMNWDLLFEGVSYFHFSAICPPLSQNVYEVCLEALQEARKRGIRVSIDLNYRKALWENRSDVVETMGMLLGSCHIVMGNIWAANELLGIPTPNFSQENRTKENFLKASKNSAQAIHRKYPQVYLVANTFRFNTANGVRYYSSLHPNEKLHPSHQLFQSNDLDKTNGLGSNKQSYTSTEYFIPQVVDAVGSGDCYMAGLLYGVYHHWPMEQIVEFASAAACTKLSVSGDATTLTVEEINQFIKRSHEQK